MTIQHGFQLMRDEYVSEIHSQVRFYKHIKSGAELLSVINDDENKVFGVNFRTPPTDSTGLPHILEHVVLGGSRKYPLKEPFIELVKGSLNTFLNAFTYPDRTCYPVASTNLQDFYNLTDVYLDSVFYPLLTRHHLDQEGWHYELEDINDPLTYRGVVFNEMKGAYSSPEGLLGKYQQETLFGPNHTYGVDSGGDPSFIPDLTYEDFKAFHDRYYHPANARLYFYGDDNPEKRLEILDAYLRDFSEIEVDSAVPIQPLRDEIQRHVYSYAADEGESDDGKNFVTLNWLLPEINDLTTEVGLAILSSILSGAPGAPLRRALTESGLGEDTIDGRFSSTLRQTTFSAGMKGVTDENIANVEALIESTLQKLVTEGIDPADISAAINTLEFRLREANTGSAPRGLIYMLGALSSWIYDKDPYESLRYEAPLHNVREAIAQGGYFESLIGQYLLENNHRSVVILKPDTELAQQIEQKETDKLAAAKANMSQADLEAIIANTEELRARQERQDSPEELEKLPSLTVNDLEKEGKSLPISIDHYDQAKVISHNLFTNGIVYFRLGLNLHVLPNELLPYVPLFCYSLTEMGTETEDYVQLGQRIGRLTGGVSAFRQISSTRQQKEAISWLWVRGKATMDHAQDMLDIMHDILHTVQLDNKERFLQMLLEEKASSESSIVPGGHIATITRLRARFSEAGWASEQMGGIEYLFFLRRLVEDVKNDWSGVLEKLERIRYLLVNRNHMICDTTLDADHYKTFVPLVHKLLDTFPSNEVVIEKWDQKTLPENEGLVIPSQVNYVGKAVNLFEHGFTHHGSVAVITKLLGTGYLWDKVRLQGGAYGAFMPYNSTTGVLSFCSYRDPNIVPTLNAYDGTADFLANLELTQSQIDKAIIGVIGDLDSYQLPDAKGATALNRYLHGITDDYRQMRRDEVLGTTLADLKRFATVLPAVSQHAHTVVIGSAEAIAEANATLETELTITPIM